MLQVAQGRSYTLGPKVGITYTLGALGYGATWSLSVPEFRRAPGGPELRRWVQELLRTTTGRMSRYKDIYIYIHVTYIHIVYK